MRTTTLISPTGARIVRQPWLAATSSTTRLVDRLVTDDPAPAPQHDVGGQRQGEILAQGPPPFVHQREPIHIGVHGQPDSRTRFTHQLSQRHQAGRRGLGVAVKPAVRLDADGVNLAPEPGQQPRHDDAPCPVHAVERDTHPLHADPPGIERGEPQDPVNVPLHRTVVAFDRHDAVPGGSRRIPLPHLRLEARHAIGGQKRPSADRKLQRVPLGGVVARGHPQSPLPRRSP